MWFIFLDHIPDNFANWFTIMNFGFSDAAEIFIFVSGYSAVLAYGTALGRDGWLSAAGRVLKRVLTLYWAHLLLFVVFAAQVLWFAHAYDDDEIVDQMGLAPLEEHRSAAVVQALLLRFQPTNLDILPLYVVLLLALPLWLPLLQRRPWVALATSFTIYVAAVHFGWNVPAFPAGRTWYFNPLAWQFVFVLGAFCARAGDIGERLRPLDNVLIPVIALFLLFACATTLASQLEYFDQVFPHWVGELIYPMSKNTVSPWRVLHFLALAYLAQRLVPFRAPVLSASWLAPLKLCGRHSLVVFVSGVVLAFAARVAHEYIDDSNLAELAVSVVGISLLCLIAYAAEAHRQRKKALSPQPAVASVNAGQ